MAFEHALVDGQLDSVIMLEGQSLFLGGAEPSTMSATSAKTAF